MKHLRLLLMLGLLAALSHAPQALAVCQSAASGSWNAGATWTGCSGTGGIPAAADGVTINAHHAITVDANASAKALSIPVSTAPASSLTINGSNSLTISNDCSLNGGSTSGSPQVVAIGAGTLQCGSMLIAAGTAGAVSQVSLSTGTLNLVSAGSPATTGTITFTGTAANAQLVSTGASTINIAGSLLTGGTLTAGTGTINFNGAGAQTIAPYITYNNVVINKTAGAATIAAATPSATFNGTFTLTAGTLTGTGSIVVGGAFIMNGGAATLSGTNNIMFGGLNMNNGTLNINGQVQSYIVSTVAGGSINVNSTWLNQANLTMNAGTVTCATAGLFAVVSGATVNGGTINMACPFFFLSTFTLGGTLNITGTAQPKTVTGLLTINSGGTWTNTSGPVTFEGGITNNGVLNGGTGIQTFNTNSQTLSGAGSMLFGGSLYVVGAITVTNNATVSAVTLGGGVASGTPGIWRQGAGGSLFVSGSLFPANTPAGSTISPTFDGTATGNIVTYNGAAQTVNLTPSYYNLSLTGSGIKTLGTATGQTLTVAGALGLLNGVTLLGSTFNPTVNITGSVTNLGTITTGNGTYTVGGNFSNLSVLGGGVTTTGTGTFSLAGNFSNVGTFTAGTGTIVFNGTTAQTFTGSNVAGSTTFNSMRLNNAAGLTMTGTHNLMVGTPSPISGTCPTVSAVPPVALTLTSGQIITGNNTLTIGNGSAIASAGGSNFVVGNLIKPFSAGASETRVFEVGTGTSYAPVTFFFSCVTTSANVTVSTAGSDHPQIATSSIDSYQSVNRYWTISVVSAHSGWFTVLASNTITFGFVAGDVDPAPTATASFVVETYTATGWSAAITPTGAGATSTTIAVSSIIPASALSATPAGFQIGDPGASIPPPSSFNAFESGTLPNPGATSGVIQTKISNSGFGVDIVALGAGGTLLTNFTGPVTVDVLGNTALGVLLAANNCPVSSTLLASVTATFVSNGRVTVALPAISNVWRDARIRITYAPTTTIACSTDNFAIRPASLVVAAKDNDWVTAGTARVLNNAVSPGGTVHKAAQPFTIIATVVDSLNNPTPNYAGSPTLKSGSPICTLPAGCVPTVPALGPWSFSNGQSSITAQYSEVGVITLEFEDQSFASVDSGDGSSYVIPQSGGALTVGRFVPDHLDVSVTTVPVFAPACVAGSFTYDGQVFTYSTPPVLTVTARNAAGAATLNYKGTAMNLTYTSLAQGMYASQSGRYTRFDALAPPVGITPALDTSGLPPTVVLPAGTSGDPTISVFAGGTGTLTFSGGTGFLFTRNPTTPAPNFAADIGLALDIIDSDLVSYVNPTLPAPADLALYSFGAATAGNGIAFNPTTSNNIYYGRMRMSNANGSELLPLKVNLAMQYFTSGAGFVTNTADSCTTFTAGTASIGRGNFRGGLIANPPTPTLLSNTFAGGTNTITLSAPGALHNGAMDMVINLGSANTPASCTALPGVTATGANLAFLRDVQSCSAGAYVEDPTAHITFGVYNLNPNSIYLRENY